MWKLHKWSCGSSIDLVTGPTSNQQDNIVNNIWNKVYMRIIFIIYNLQTLWSRVSPRTPNCGLTALSLTIPAFGISGYFSIKTSMRCVQVSIVCWDQLTTRGAGRPRPAQPAAVPDASSVWPGRRWTAAAWYRTRTRRADTDWWRELLANHSGSLSLQRENSVHDHCKREFICYNIRKIFLKTNLVQTQPGSSVSDSYQPWRRAPGRQARTGRRLRHRWWYLARQCCQKVRSSCQTWGGNLTKWA